MVYPELSLALIKKQRRQKSIERAGLITGALAPASECLGDVSLNQDAYASSLVAVCLEWRRSLPLFWDSGDSRLIGAKYG